MSDSDKIVIDTYAWIEYFKGSEEGNKAKKFIESDLELFTPSIVIAELSDKYLRENLKEEWEIRNKFIRFKTKILHLEENTADKAGELKQKLKEKYKDAGLADAIIWAHALNVNARILTGDKHLRSLKESIDLTR